MIAQSDALYHVIIRELSGSRYEADMEPNETFESLLQKMAREHNRPEITSARLTFAGCPISKKDKYSVLKGNANYILAYIPPRRIEPSISPPKAKTKTILKPNERVINKPEPVSKPQPEPEPIAIYENSVTELMSLGFSPEATKEALRQAKGVVSVAANLLLEGNISVDKPKSTPPGGDAVSRLKQIFPRVSESEIREVLELALGDESVAASFLS